MTLFAHNLNGVIALKIRILSTLCLLALGAADVSARPLDRLRARRGGCGAQSCAGGNCGAPQGRYTLFPRR